MTGIRPLTTLAVLLALFLAVAPSAAEEKTEWSPEEPEPDNWDWIQLVSGEWLKGEVIEMYGDSMLFDSDKLNELSLDFGDIVTVRSGGTMRILLAGQEVATGRLLIEGDNVRVFGDEGGTFQKSDVITIAAGEPKELNFWAMKVGLGINVRTGNTEQTDLNVNARFQRRTVKNRIDVDYVSNFSEVTDPESGNTNETANNQRASAGWDKFITDRFYVSPIFAEWYRDPFVNIASRWTFGVGAGYDIIDTAKTTLTLSGGPGYQTSRFTSVDPITGDDSSDTAAFLLSTVFDKELTSWIDFIWNYRFQIVNEESGSYNHHMVTSLETELTSLLDLDFSWIWDRIEDPRPNQDATIPEQDDNRFVVSLSFDW
jgi:putative salt-induced outer membrane protein YdiY